MRSTDQPFNHSATKRSAFSLVEVVIVIVIIGFISAVAMPKFAQAKRKTVASQIAHDLKIVNDAIEAYLMDHNGMKPGVIQGGGVNPTQANFIEQLTGESNSKGEYQPSSGGTPHGPYLPQIPVNPLNPTGQVFPLAATPFDPELHSSLPGFAWYYELESGAFNVVTGSSMSFEELEVLASPAQIQY